MKTLILIVALAILGYFSAFSQGCLPQGITFYSQEDIDNFQANYAWCTEIEGDVHIGYYMGTDINNLNGLSNLTAIDGDLWIQANEYMTSLNGLNNLISIGNDFGISGNDLLTDLNGLQNLSDIGGEFYLEQNDGLTSLNGLNSIFSLHDCYFGNNHSLSSFTGLENLTSIEGFLFIGYSDTLTSLDGLENLTSIGDYLYINDCDGLVDLNPLHNLATIGGYLCIRYNDDLTSLNGLENISAGSIEDLYVWANPILSFCSVQSICDYLAAPNGSVTIHDNAPGCNNPEEVQEICGFLSPCLPEGITFTSQEGIDSFQANYPGCMEIQGNVEISNDSTGEITNLNGLSVLTSIGGYLNIYNTSLSDLAGLESLISIGGFLGLQSNEWLTSLSGLNNLTTVIESVGIGNDMAGTGNPQLTDLTGLESLTSVGLNFFIEGNESLTSLDGLDNLTTVNGSFIIKGNPSLTSLSGLENLTTIEGQLFISFNDSIINFSGLNSLTQIGLAINIGLNPKLMDLTGLENLLSIGGSLTFYDNDSLNNLSALNNLTSIGGDLNINDNTILTSLLGLDSIDPNSIINLTITNNPNLTYCAVQSICDYLDSPNGTIEIYGNEYGCDNEEQIDDACWISIKENEILKEIIISPNPASSFISLTAPGDLPIEEAIIYNHLGQMVLTAKPVNNTVDVSGLKVGMYMMEVKTKDFTGRQKLIKQ